SNKPLLLHQTTAFAIVSGMWKDIITSLVRSGMTQVQIAEAAGISQAHVSDLMNGRRGKRVSFDIGRRLEALHAKRCGEHKAVA
ncbi:helix-turn-helix transcriptional regulator, partial [Arthrospira platensis SPKY1]|nr:helix-turn-helix transcriptional regulator [Arthrospira platensis SPKY1]